MRIGRESKAMFQQRTLCHAQSKAVVQIALQVPVALWGLLRRVVRTMTASLSVIRIRICHTSGPIEAVARLA